MLMANNALVILRMYLSTPVPGHAGQLRMLTMIWPNSHQHVPDGIFGPTSLVQSFLSNQPDPSPPHENLLRAKAKEIFEPEGVKSQGIQVYRFQLPQAHLGRAAGLEFLGDQLDTSVFYLTGFLDQRS